MPIKVQESDEEEDFRPQVVTLEGRTLAVESIDEWVECQGRREIVPAGRSKTMPLNAAV